MFNKEFKVLTITVFLLNICFAKSSFAGLEDQIIGRWTAKYTQSDASSSLTSDGVDEYLPNHTEKSSGSLIVDQSSGGEKMHGLLRFTVSGTWQVGKDGLLYETITNSQVVVGSFKVNGTEILDERREIFRQLMSETLMPGFTAKIKTISIDSNTWVEQLEEDGQIYQVTARRVN